MIMRAFHSISFFCSKPLKAQHRWALRCSPRQPWRSFRRLMQTQALSAQTLAEAAVGLLQWQQEWRPPRGQLQQQADQSLYDSEQLRAKLLQREVPWKVRLRGAGGK